MYYSAFARQYLIFISLWIIDIVNARNECVFEQKYVEASMNSIESISLVSRRHSDFLFIRSCVGNPKDTSS